MKMIRYAYRIFHFLTCCSMVSCSDDLRLNDIQVIGSHNSYKIAIEAPLMNHLKTFDSVMAHSLEYDHIPLAEQLDLGLRNLEMDVLHDSKGGRYSHPRGLEILKMSGEPQKPYDVLRELEKPGLKMFHIQDIDFRSHHLLFKEGLKEVKEWSDKNQGHTPIFITINAKDSNRPELTVTQPFTAGALDSIDLAIKEIFPQEKLITPDMVRGNFESLENAILTKGWPKLSELRGKLMFILDEQGEKMRRYLTKHPNLLDAVLFVNQKEGNPEAGFRIINDPVKEHAYIKELVLKGYLVRTRADSGTKEARNENYTKFEKAKSSGAQIITTDYYVPSKLFKSIYKVQFEDGTYERIKN